MYIHNPWTSTPPDDTVLWRYMNILSLLHLIETRTLHFHRTDLFSDPYEGAFPLTEVEHMRTVDNVAKKIAASFESDSTTIGNAIHQLAAISPDLSRSIHKLFCVNCWHMNPTESLAMWAQYTTIDHGIAICTTFDRLKRALVCDEPVSAGQVSYIDFERDSMPNGQWFTSRHLFKRKCFEHERELRIATATPFSSNPFTSRLTNPKLDAHLLLAEGIDLIVELQTLIEAIYVAPTTHEWQLNVYKKLLERSGIECQVHRSSIEDKPSWS